MERRAWIASVLFAALCAGGITTMLSQAPEAGAGRRPIPSAGTALDPAGEPATGFGDIVPVGLEKGLQAQAPAATKRGAPEGPQTLRLR